jgi:hypothetical protein
MSVSSGKVDLSKRITIARATSAKAFEWHTLSETIGQFLDKRIFPDREGHKDGPCITQGGLVGNRRVKRAVISQHILMLDHDTGVTIDEVGKRYKAEGLRAVLWPTHSHNKTYTDISESALLRWCKKHDLFPNVKAGCRYLTIEKNYEPSVFDDTATIEKEASADGAVYRITHPPMPRSRSLVFLKEPFVFVSDDVSVSQDEAMRLWTEKYLGFAQHMGFHADPSCADPSRLMYLPARPVGTDPDDYAQLETEGGYLDLDKVKTVARGAYGKDKFAAGLASLGTSGGDFKTPGLLKFVAKYSDSFRISDFFADAFPDSFIKEEGGKFTFLCPSDDVHTNAGDPTDTGFYVEDACADKGWWAFCSHGTCHGLSNKDRAWYLDRACQNAGITDASQLEKYADEAVEEAAVAEAAVEHRAGLTKESTASEVREALRGVAALDPLDQDTALKSLSKQVDKSLGTMREAMRGVHATLALEAQENAPDPLANMDTRTYEGPINVSWPFLTQLELIKANIMRNNKVAPRIFTEPATGKVIRVLDEGTGVRTAITDTPNQWLALAVENCSFIDNNGDSAPPSPQLIGVCQGTETWDFNRLDRIVNVPQMGRDGVIHYTEGYKPDICSYMRPNVKFPPLPDDGAGDAVWRAEVSEALRFFFCETVRDFPFVDYGLEDIQRPIKLEERDADGHRLPNLERGAGSRINFLAMVLQGFIRPALGSCCPAYHIDKAAAGTGAGFLTNVASYILTGSAARPINVTRNEEELNKIITAELRRYPQITFLDNINHKLDSASLATAITAGEWSGRKLGDSDMLDLPVKTIWIIAGNNVSFTDELVRRMVPINMDAKCDAPATDRTEASFKYNPLDSWLAANRGAIVRACLVLIANWARLGAPSGPTNVNTFSEWSYAMSGIMKTADEVTKGEHRLTEGFLRNLREYSDSHRDGEDDSRAFITCLWHDYSNKAFGGTELLRTYRANEDTCDLSNIKLMSPSDADNKKYLTAHVTKVHNGRWTTVDDGHGGTVKVRLTRATKRGRSGVTFNLEPDNETPMS